MLLMSAATGLSAQVTDTISITIVGNVTSVTISGEYVTPFRVGDSVVFRANVVDEDGDPLAALLTYFTEDSTALRLEELPDGEALGIALKKATVRVWVVAEPITEMRLASFRDGRLSWTRYDTINVGDSIQYCAYATRGGTVLVAESPGPPTCPMVFEGPTLPAWLPLVDRTMDRRAFDALRVNAGQD